MINGVGFGGHKPPVVQKNTDEVERLTRQKGLLQKQLDALKYSQNGADTQNKQKELKQKIQKLEKQIDKLSKEPATEQASEQQAVAEAEAVSQAQNKSALDTIAAKQQQNRFDGVSINNKELLNAKALYLIENNL